MLGQLPATAVAVCLAAAAAAVSRARCMAGSGGLRATCACSCGKATPAMSFQVHFPSSNLRSAWSAEPLAAAHAPERLGKFEELPSCHALPSRPLHSFAFCRFADPLAEAHAPERLGKFEELLEAAVDMARVPDEYVISPTYDSVMRVFAELCCCLAWVLVRNCWAPQWTWLVCLRSTRPRHL